MSKDFFHQSCFGMKIENHVYFEFMTVKAENKLKILLRTVEASSIKINRASVFFENERESERKSKTRNNGLSTAKWTRLRMDGTVCE